MAEKDGPALRETNSRFKFLRKISFRIYEIYDEKSPTIGVQRMELIQLCPKLVQKTHIFSKTLSFVHQICGRFS